VTRPFYIIIHIIFTLYQLVTKKNHIQCCRKEKKSRKNPREKPRNNQKKTTWERTCNGKKYFSLFKIIPKLYQNYTKIIRLYIL